MKRVIKIFARYSITFTLILILGFSNVLPQVLEQLGLSGLAEKLKIPEAHAATLEYVGGAEASGSNVAYTVSLTALTGGSGTAAAANDLVIVSTGFTGIADGDPGVGTAGYTEVADLWANDTNDANFSVNWKIMGGTPDTTVSCNGSAGSTIGSVCVVHVWRNASGTPMDVTRTTATGINATTINNASITPVTSGTVVIATGLAGMGAVDTTITAPTGYGNQVDISNDPGTAATVGISSKAWTSGAEDPAAWTGITTSTADSWGAVTMAIRAAPDTTLGSGTDPASATVAPESGIRDGGTFTLQATSGTDLVTALTVILAASGTPYDGLSEVRVTSDNGATLYFAAISNPSSNTLSFSGGTAIPVSTTSTPFKIRVTPKTHANMPAPAGAEYALSPRVSVFTSTNSQTGSDSNANTLTIDNLSPNGATFVSGSAGVQAVTVNWTTSNSSDFNTTSGSVVYRWAAASAGSEVPAENSTPAIGSTNVTATVACVTSSAASTAQSKIDGNGGSVDCTTANLNAGQAYTYKVFQKDTNSNYDVGVLIGTFTPTASTVVTVDEIGTQSSPLIIPSTGNYIGGAFTMIRGTGTANVTSITITESGTVDALNNLNNIKLQYDLDTVAPYDCASVSYDALDTQYGATDINGFSAANGTSIFTGSVAVSDVQAMCVYVVLDVLSAASDGQTMIIRITNPSTDVVVSAGTVDPTTAQGLGTTTLEVPKITVATEGTQANMIIGTGDNNVGGAFSFTRNTASANVTQIIITDTGTVTANTNISDVRVYYKQEGTCSSTIPVDATLFNSTAGAFNVSEKSTVTGTMAVGTSKICVYVRVDVGDGATGGQTLEIEISNPSTEVTASAGSVVPASAVSIAGTTTLNLPTYTSLGIPFLYTSANWGTDGSGVSFYLEVYMRQTTGTAYARLLNETDGTAVTNSTLSTTSGSFTRIRSVALTLTNGKTYRVQFGKIGADAGETMGGKLVVNQNQGGGGGGADLAEFYSSPDQLDLAEVVVSDPAKAAGVKRSTQPYQKNLLGVVATQPGIILGENTGQSYPVALVGRVPVRVTTENGPIKAGDYLTSSSTPGHAMRATQAGRVLGQALESLDEKNLRDCPNGGQRTCGTVMAFVNLIDYLGSSVETAMEEKSQDTQDGQGVTLEETQTPIASYTDSIATSEAVFKNDQNNKQEKILSFLKELKDSQKSHVSSEIFVGRVAATDEVITPLVFADTVYAKRIKADSIEGLEIITGRISALSNQVAGVATTSATLTPDSTATPSAVLTNNNIVQLGNITIESAKVSLDLIVLGKLETQGGLIVNGPAEFKNDTIFNSLAQFISKVIFRGDVLFEGRPTFNKDTAGYAVIVEGAKQVRIVFDKEYSQIPIVTSSPIWDISEEDLSALTQKELYLLQKQDFVVAAVTTKGFTILLEEPAVVDLKFSWTAMAVKDAKIHSSPATAGSSSQATQANEATPTPDPQQEPTATSTLLNPSPSPSENE